MTEQQPPNGTTNVLLFVLILVVAVPAIGWVYAAGNPWVGTGLAVALVILSLWFAGQGKPPRAKAPENPKDRPWLR